MRYKIPSVVDFPMNRCNLPTLDEFTDFYRSLDVEQYRSLRYAHPKCIDIYFRFECKLPFTFPVPLKCGAGMDTLCIDSLGNIYPCLRAMHSNFKPLLTVQSVERFDSIEIRNKIFRGTKLDKCRECEIANRCPQCSFPHLLLGYEHCKLAKALVW